jgi:Putative stress-responsive transcriptional regulator
LINVIGRPEDFEESESKEKATSDEGNTSPFNNVKKAKLYRNNADKIIGGVCSGIANYVAIDPIAIRLCL